MSRREEEDVKEGMRDNSKEDCKMELNVLIGHTYTTFLTQCAQAPRTW